MKRIASFEVDHDLLTPGMYTSRVDDDIITYDIRMFLPNAGEYLYPPAAHTFEHLFATYVRNTPLSNHIVYVGPMGCLTGFYFVVRNLEPAEAIRLVRETMDFVQAFEGTIPGSSQAECGNYQMHDLVGAKRIAAKMAPILENWTTADLVYRTSKP